MTESEGKNDTEINNVFDRCLAISNECRERIMRIQFEAEEQIFEIFDEAFRPDEMTPDFAYSVKLPFFFQLFFEMD